MSEPPIHPPFLARVDVAPVLVDFISALRSDDIVTEIVQNDLDQGATKTHVRFTPRALIAEGNGRPVDAAGWKRLSYLLGAGGEVDAKREGIGVKNHGLRSCFALGDEIIVRSAGRQTRLALRTRGERGPLSPGAWEHPMEDPEAPLIGAQVQVLFRSRPLRVRLGEEVELQVPSEPELARIFAVTIAQSPLRYLGCVRPGMSTRYTLTIEHWRLGTCTFTYTSGPLRRKGKLRGFRRSCEARLPDGRTEVTTEEAVLIRPRIPLGRIPRWYRDKAGALCEISWVTGSRGQPVPAPGRLRYPIAYAADAVNARTELGASFSAPFISETRRHGVADGARSYNVSLTESCERALVRLLRDYLIPRYGPAALGVLQDPEHPGSEGSARLVAAAARAGALPAAPTARRGRLPAVKNGGRAKTSCVPPPGPSRWSFLIPTYRLDSRRSPVPLPELAPRGMAQLHPAVPAFVRDTLLEEVARANGDVPYITFDEYDVIARLQGSKDAWFPWAADADRRRELSDPSRARLYLDVLSVAHKTGSLGKKVDEIRRNGQLPDQFGEPQPWEDLSRQKKELTEIPGVDPPRYVHPSLFDHPVLARGSLKIEPFKLSAYLIRLDFHGADPDQRAAFFDWLTRHESHVSGEAMERLAQQPIWPTLDGGQVNFAELCLPKAALRRTLDGYVHQPTPAVVSLRRVHPNGRGLLRLRVRPTREELRAWYDDSVERFPMHRALTDEEATEWRSFERDLMRLRSDALIRGEMAWVGRDTPGLCEDAHLRLVGSVHLGGPTTDACRLLPEDRLRGGAKELYTTLGARTRPSADALVRALSCDPGSQDVLYARLAALAEARRVGDHPGEDPSRIEFLCIEGGMYPPCRVAIRSPRDFWGAWRVPFGADHLATDRQLHLRAVGVAGRTPDRESSRRFFEWLTDQREPVLRSHLDQVIRHFLHDQGPLSWWEAYPNVRCLPVYTFRNQLRLLSRREAFTSSNPALLPDYAALEKRVLERDRRKRIVIVDAPRVTDSIFSKLKKAGMKSLRQVALPAVVVRADSAGTRSEPLSARLDVVTGDRFGADLRKRLQEMHVDRDVLRLRWQNEVRGLQEVRTVPGLEACLRVGSLEYWLRVHSAPDGERGVLWISEDAPSPVDAFYAALAERVFEDGAPPYLAFALQAAVGAGYEVRFEGPPAGGGEVEEDGEASDGRPAKEGKSADVSRAHSTAGADRLPNQPSPGPIKPPFSRTHSDFRWRHRRRAPTRPELPDERAVIDDLKAKHYAWHCQVCLAASQPTQLAAPGSYAFRPVHRRSFIVGHHVDPVQGQGVRSVGNVLILCEYHHLQLGDKLERSALRQALRDGPRRRVLQFFDADGSRTDVAGTTVSMTLDTEPWNASIFFTVPHADAWLTSEE